MLTLLQEIQQRGHDVLSTSAAKHTPSIRSVHGLAFFFVVGLVLLAEVVTSPVLAAQPATRVAAKIGPAAVQAALEDSPSVQVIVTVENDSGVALASPSQYLARARIPPFAAQQAAVSERLRAQGLRVKRQFKTVPAIVTEVDRRGLELLLNTPGVVDVVVDEIYQPMLDDTVPLIDADILHNQGIDGAGYAVAILDTGVESSHPMFADSGGNSRVVAEACFSSNTTAADSLCPNAKESQIGTGAGAACVGISGCDHGTHVAAIAAGSAVRANGIDLTGVAPAADIVAIQVFSEFTSSTSCNGNPPCLSAYNSDILAGLEWLGTLDVSQGGVLNVAAANMSLGGGRYYEPCTGSSIGPGIDALWNIGIASVIASGNDGFSDSISSPACYPTAIAVGATTKLDQVASYSNMDADLVDILAPGSQVFAAVANGGYGSKSGTSMATPHVAGAWALMRQAGAGNGTGSGVDALLSIFQESGVSIDPRSGGELGFSHKRIDLDAALARLNSDSDWLTVNVTGSGSVSSSPAGIDCGSTCAMEIAVGDSIELTATANAGYQLAEWSGCTSVNNNTCTVSVTKAGNRTVSVAFVLIPPNNDDFASALLMIANPLSTTKDTAGATLETSEPIPSCDPTAGASVWYTWTAPDDGQVRLGLADTVGSNFDTVLDIVSGTSLSELQSLDCDYGTPAAEWTDSAVSFFAIPGVTYYVRISGYEGTTGNAVLNWEFLEEMTVTASVTGAEFGSIVSDSGLSCGAAGTDCSVPASIGSTVTLNAQTTARGKLVSWGGACADVAVSQPCVLEILGEDIAVSATFEFSQTIYHDRFEVLPQGYF